MLTLLLACSSAPVPLWSPEQVTGVAVPVDPAHAPLAPVFEADLLAWAAERQSSADDTSMTEKISASLASHSAMLEAFLAVDAALRVGTPDDAELEAFEAASRGLLDATVAAGLPWRVNVGASWRREAAAPYAVYVHTWRVLATTTATASEAAPVPSDETFGYSRYYAPEDGEERPDRSGLTRPVDLGLALSAQGGAYTIPFDDRAPLVYVAEVQEVAMQVLWESMDPEDTRPRSTRVQDEVKAVVGEQAFAVLQQTAPHRRTLVEKVLRIRGNDRYCTVLDPNALPWYGATSAHLEQLRACQKADKLYVDQVEEASRALQQTDGLEDALEALNAFAFQVVATEAAGASMAHNPSTNRRSRERIGGLVALGTPAIAASEAARYCRFAHDERDPAEHVVDTLGDGKCTRDATDWSAGARAWQTELVGRPLDITFTALPASIPIRDVEPFISPG